MSGVPGAGGPVPKRSSQRRRRNTPEVPVDEAPGAAEVAVPAPDQGWHPMALAWFEALAASGQSAWYEPSDWATAVLVAESISRDLKPQVVGVTPETGEPVFAKIPLKGASLAAYLKAFGLLLVTEGDRRRARLELQRAQAEEAPADVSELDEYRSRLSR